MPTPIVSPDVGAGDMPVRISGWLVGVGDAIETGDSIVELLLPGMTFTVSAPAAGRLRGIDKPPDAAVSPGEVLGWIEEETRE